MPPPPELRFEFAATEKAFSLVSEELFTPDFMNKELVDDVFISFCNKASDVLGVDIENPDGITKTLMNYYGKALDGDVREEIAWRLAAGRSLLVRDKELSPFLTGTEPVWLPFRIEDVSFGRLTRDRKYPTVEVTFRVLEGRFGGLCLKQTILYSYFMRKVAREIGFPKYKPFNKSELAQCWLVGHLVFDPEARLDDFHASSSVRTRVKYWRDTRAKPCIRGYEWPCHKCPVGFAADDKAAGRGEMPCFRAVHPKTFVLKYCPKCHTENYFDPSKVSEICLGCSLEPIKTRLRILYRIKAI